MLLHLFLLVLDLSRINKTQIHCYNDKMSIPLKRVAFRLMCQYTECPISTGSKFIIIFLTVFISFMVLPMTIELKFERVGGIGNVTIYNIS